MMRVYFCFTSHTVLTLRCVVICSDSVYVDFFFFFAERRSPISRGMSGMNVEGQCPDSRDLFLTIDVTGLLQE